jgi:MscS family membrane protein
VPLVLAWVLGPLATRALRRLGSRRGAALGQELERTAGRPLRLLLLLIALSWVVSLAPLPEGWGTALGAAIFVLAVLVATRLAMRVGAALLHAWLASAAAGPERDRAQKEYLPIASSVTTVALALTAAIVVAHHFGHDVTSLVAALGIGSLAIGLAAQPTLSNMIAGFTLLVDRPFRPGDRVRLASGELGEVMEIGIRSTRILLEDANLLIVPNAELANSRVVNFAYPTQGGRGEVRVRVAWARAEEVLSWALEAARAQPDVLADPAPAVAVVALVEQEAELAVRFHVIDQARRRPVEEGIRRALAARLSTR